LRFIVAVHVSAYSGGPTGAPGQGGARPVVQGTSAGLRARIEFLRGVVAAAKRSADPGTSRIRGADVGARRGSGGPAPQCRNDDDRSLPQIIGTNRAGAAGYFITDQSPRRTRATSDDDG